jgi:beta-phosphoglucomutase-like phosphatase (HAD superfamily)
VRYLRAARDARLRRAVVWSSTHTAEILRAAGLEDLLEVRVDGLVAQQEALRGKPAPDTYLAARRLGVEPAAAAVFEDALAGVAAGHRRDTCILWCNSHRGQPRGPASGNRTAPSGCLPADWRDRARSTLPPVVICSITYRAKAEVDS